MIPGVPSILSPDDPEFDPNGAGYDDKTAKELIQLYPLTIPKPKSYQGDYINDGESFQSWVWHPELNDYKIHSASFDPRTGMLLKGLKHPSIGKTMAEERKLLNTIIRNEQNKRYYTVPIIKLMNPR